MEAALMARILDTRNFTQWWQAFSQPQPELQIWLMPVSVSAPDDPKLAHLDGLNLSRAWCWQMRMDKLPGALQPSITAAINAHLAASLPQALSGTYAGTHWLASFALLAMTAPLKKHRASRPHTKRQRCALTCSHVSLSISIQRLIGNGMNVAIPSVDHLTGIVSIGHYADADYFSGFFPKSPFKVFDDIAPEFLPLADAIVAASGNNHPDSAASRAWNHSAYRRLVFPYIHQRGIGKIMPCYQFCRFEQHLVGFWFGGLVVFETENDARRRIFGFPHEIICACN